MASMPPPGLASDVGVTGDHVSPPSVDSLRWIRCAAVASRKNASSAPVAELDNGWLRHPHAGDRPRERPRLAAVARDGHRGDVEVLVGEWNQECAVLQGDRMNSRHPPETASERIVQAIEHAARPLARLAGSAVPSAGERCPPLAPRPHPDHPVWESGRWTASSAARRDSRSRSRLCTAGGRCPTPVPARPAAWRERATAASHRRCRARGCCPTRRTCRRSRTADPRRHRRPSASRRRFARRLTCPRRRRGSNTRGWEARSRTSTASSDPFGVWTMLEA